METKDSTTTDRLWAELEDRLTLEPAGQPRKVLLATDGSEPSDVAVRFLGLLPLAVGSRIQVVTVTEGRDWAMPEWYTETGYAWAKRTAEAALPALVRDGVEVTAAARIGACAYEIIQAAEEFEADLVVLGSHGLTGLEGFLLGSVARNVAKHARRPVLVAREATHGLRRVILAVDESKHAVQAVEYAARLPLPPETEVVVLNVVRPYHPYPGLAPDDLAGFQREVAAVSAGLHRTAEKLVERAAHRLKAVGKHVTTEVLEGDPATEVLRLAAAEEADLIIAGARGHSLIEGLLVGSVADRLLKTARCSVLLVR
jgi:nucleotide-binding universal stress UspA family protein